MIKLIVSDFDGTLLSYGDKRVRESVKNRIRAALDCGITVAISSGRTYGELAGFLPEFTESLFFICCDGAYYVKNGTAVYQRKIEDSDLLPFFSGLECNSSLVLHGAFRNYSAGQTPDEAMRFDAIPIKKMGDVKEKIFKITSYGREIKLAPYSGLRMHWDGGINACTQLVNRFANKGTALSDLQVRLMLTKFETACIGDSGNDVAMMKNAKLSFAVGSRSRELSDVTDRKVSTAEEAFDAVLKQL